MALKLFQFLARFRVLLIVLALIAAGTGSFLIARGWGASTPPGQTTKIPLNGVSGVTTTTSPAQVKGGTPGMTGQLSSISIRLSQGKAQPQAVALAQVATGEPLSPGEIEALLARLPQLTAEPGDPVDLKLPGDPIPPPRPGETIKSTFPPAPEDVAPVTVDSGPLKVLRFAPEGEMPVAPFINITFSQPMVALDTIDDLAAGQVPVQVDPNIPGTWRWLGTRTLNFQADSELIDRLPKATVYHVTIPAGIKSATGGTLAETVEWSFTTPPPKITYSSPVNEPQPRDPLFFIHFDQRINPAAVLENIQVTAAGQTIRVKPVNESDIKANEKWSPLLNNALEGRWLAFQAAELLPANATVDVTVKSGTPSAEGPLTTTEAQSFSFSTYAPLRIEEHGCNWGGNECRPLMPFYIRFNNPINPDLYDPSMISIEPELPGASIDIYGNTINIQGASQGRTTYTVTISGSIQDTFGQTLGQDTRLTFKVGSAEPVLAGPGQNFMTLDPVAKKPVFSVYTINYNTLDVKVYAVQPTDWPAYKAYLRDWQRTDVAVTVPGRLVMNKTLPVEAAADVLTEVNIDLAPLMDGPYGHFVVIVKPPLKLLQDPQQIYWQTVQAWVQVTQIGLDAFADYSDMVVWASALKDGAPLANVAITAENGTNLAATGADGTSRFAIPNGSSYLIASQGADKAILPRTTYWWGDDPWLARSFNDELRWFVFDDRQMYRPGEEMHVKGWLRRIGSKQTGDVGLVGDAVNAVNYQVVDAQGNTLLNGRSEVNALGGFDMAISLPEQVNLGYAYINLTGEGSLSGMDGNGYTHSFQIQEFRRPEFEVTARNESTGPYFANGSATVAVSANYYAGGPLPGADVTWQVSSTPGSYSPPNWPEFTFGTWTPWWGRDYYFERFGPMGGGETKIETFAGQTDAGGEHFLQLDFEGDPQTRPISILAEATVMDVNRQAWTGSTTLLVHPASLYVGLRSDKVFVERGTPIKVDIIVTDLDGSPVADRPVEVTAARMEWKYKSGQWQEVEVDAQVCSVGSSTEPVTCSFETPLGGSYRITAVITDEQGRKNQSQLTRWVSGGKVPPARNVEQEMVTLIPDKQDYQPGDVAQVLVQSPFSPAEGLLTVNRSGLLYTERFRIEDGTYTLQIPIEEAHIPNLNIQVDLAGAAPRTDDQGEILPGVPARPAFASGQLTLTIPPLQRTLAVSVTPAQKELEPGGETTLDVNVKDASGQPIADAELSVVVVDEAVLALSNYQLADPLATFYSPRPMDWMSVYGRASIILIDPLALSREADGRMAESQALSKSAGGANRSLNGMEAPAAPAPAATMAADMAFGAAPQSAQPQPIRVRINFNPLAVFAPAEHTDADGNAQVTVKLPDNLTRYRVMVVAVDSKNKFGTAETNLVARLPLMVRPSAPRFLNFGDHFELPVVLQNQTDEPMTVDVAVRVTNLELTADSGLRVTVPPRDRLEVRFPTTTQRAGTARIQIAATSGNFADAATIELPVYTPATTEAFATYGVLDEGAVAQPVASPQNVFPQYGGLEITTSSTALQALTDAVLYLVQYPYDCSEQMASRILAISALRDVLTAFDAAGMPTPEDMKASVQTDLDMLQKLHNDDGGFPYWRRGQESSPFNTIHVAHALYSAQSKGFSVPSDMQQRALTYLRDIESHYPTWYSKNTRQVLSSYALYVRNLSGEKDANKALRLLDEAGGVDQLPLDAIGWLWPVLQDAAGTESRIEEIRLLVNNRVVETAGAANFTTEYDDQNYLLLGSDRRTDAILLDALMLDNPQSDLIPKVVNGLLAHRTRGRWGNTQENVFILLALDHYFNTYESQTPDFVARIWLGDTYAGSSEFRGRTTDRHQTDIPMTYLVDPALGGETQDIILSKDGPGRLYYRLGLRYAPTSLKLAPLDMGFVVRRVYEAVDDPDDVSQDSDGAWHIKAGARVKVHLTMVADNRRYHVALVDPLPAGLEIINPDLAVSGGLPQDPTQPDYKFFWWWGTWYEHQNLRDERAEAFTTLLWDGVYNYSYFTRATTPGTFVVPPSKAEEMYSPEVFGRGGSDIVIIK